MNPFSVKNFKKKQQRLDRYTYSDEMIKAVNFSLYFSRRKVLIEL